MSEGPPKKNHVWPPGPSGKRVHAHEVLGLGEADKHIVDKIKSAERKLRAKHSADREGGSEAHVKTIGAAAKEAIARAEGRWDERLGEERPKETLQSLRTAELSAQAGVENERRRPNPNLARIQQYESEIREIQRRKKNIEREEAIKAAAEDRAHQERIEAEKLKREAAAAAEEQERLARVAAAESNAQDGTNNAESENVPTEEEEPVATGTAVVVYREESGDAVAQGEVIDHPIEPPGTEVARIMEALDEEQEVPREPGTAVVAARESSSTDVVPANTERRQESGVVVPYEEDEYFPLAAAGGGGGEGGGGGGEDAPHDDPEEHDPHHAHTHAHAHDEHHGHGDHHHDHGHDSHGSHDAHHAGSHGHGEEKKKGLWGAWWSFFGSLFSFAPDTVKGFGAFFKSGGGGGGGGGESHGHH